MAIHNWIRCHWRNGRHVLHDVPEGWHAAIETHLAAHRARARDLGLVQLATLDELELAWVECEVPLGSPAGDLTYRRARAVHALARPRGTGGPWTRHEVETLLHERYGEPVRSGLATQHRVLTRLTHPADVDHAAGLFVGVEAPLPSEIDAEDALRAVGGDGGYARRHLIDAWEEWVAEARRSPRTPLQAEPSTVAQLASHAEADALARLAAHAEADAVTPSPVQVEVPPAPARPLHVEVPPAPARPVDVEAPPAPARPVDVEAPPAPARPVDVEAPPAVPLPLHACEPEAALPSIPAEPVEAGPAEESQLFDLSRITRDGSDAPASSLSGLLGPSYTTSAGY